MKNVLLVLCLLMTAAVARADDLADGLKAWEKKDFTTALQIYTRLAETGNPEAQFQLGEMIGYGEGRAEDLALSERWLAKAQAGGHKDAAASIATMRQRAARKSDIAYYTGRYDGADLSLASRRCVAPAVPPLSRTRAEIKEVGAALDAWTACYNGFVSGLGAALPAGTAIPPDVAKLMSTTEFDTARQRMDARYAAMAADAASQAAAVEASAGAWRVATERHVKAEAVTTARLREEQRVTAEQSRAVTQAAQDAKARGGK